MCTCLVVGWLLVGYTAHAGDMHDARKFRMLCVLDDVANGLETNDDGMRLAPEVFHDSEGMRVLEERDAVDADSIRGDVRDALKARSSWSSCARKETKREPERLGHLMTTS